MNILTTLAVVTASLSAPLAPHDVNFNSIPGAIRVSQTFNFTASQLPNGGDQIAVIRDITGMDFIIDSIYVVNELNGNQFLDNIATAELIDGPSGPLVMGWQHFRSDDWFIPQGGIIFRDGLWLRRNPGGTNIRKRDIVVSVVGYLVPE